MMRQQLNPSGLIVALLGFFLTRFTVTFALSDTPLTFVVGSVTPLVLGLSLSAFGVALTFAAFERWYVRTIALWTILGASVIGVLVLATIYGPARHLFEGVEAAGVFSNVLIGGSVGGALTGVYSAKNQSYQRKLLNRQNRLVVLNRLLHDQVMNAVTGIKGSLPLLQEEAETGLDTEGIIDEKTQAIEQAMSSVRDLTEPGRPATLETVRVTEVVDNAIERARERHPGAQYIRQNLPSDATAYADDRLVEALYQLIVNGVEHAETGRPRVTVGATVQDRSVTLSVMDEGPGLSREAREALEEGTTIANGDPTTGLGLYLARLFVRSVLGSIETEVTDRGTTVSITLARRTEEREPYWSFTPADGGIGVMPERLASTAIVSLFAGVVMGAYVHFLTGQVPIIGALYGTENAFVGVLTHQFHSVVFGLVYAGLLEVTPIRDTEEWTGRVGLGLAWSTGLWLLASGVIMPIWLNLVGFQAPVPNLGLHSLVAHLIWGLVLGGGEHVSRRWEFPRSLRNAGRAYLHPLRTSLGR